MDAGVDDSLFQVSACGQHDQLLARYQQALEAWAKLRETSWNLGLHGKELTGELLRLQAEFARAYTLLHQHTRECLLCRFGTKLTFSDGNAAVCPRPQMPD